MILENLKLIDFGVFQGIHEFKLTPRERHKRQAPIILFGGLNGTGKTTILTAILTVLYGKQSLGFGTKNKDYQEFLKNYIHQTTKTQVTANSAALSLIFSLARVGEVFRYEVKRSWSIKGNEVTEQLRISQNHEELNSLNYDQAQAFLNDLVPIGVSNLFFFDGEKVKELADDNSGLILANSIKSLLGLNLIDRLRLDLDVVVRNYQKSMGDDSIKGEISELEEILKIHEEKADSLLEQYEQLRLRYIESSCKVDRLDAELQAHGGAWIRKRNFNESKRSLLLEEKKILEEKIRSNLSGMFPLCLASSFLRNLEKTLRNERTQRISGNTYKLLHPRITSLKDKVERFFDGADLEKILNLIDSNFDDIEQFKMNELRHDIGERKYLSITNMICSLPEVHNVTVELFHKLTAITNELRDVESELSQTPDESILTQHFQKLTEANNNTNMLKVELAVLNEKRRQNLRFLKDTTRKLQNHYLTITNYGKNARSCRLAASTKNLLKDFVQKATVAKALRFENEFINSYSRLIGKKTEQIGAKIDPDTFVLRLFNSDGSFLDKHRLSAGEKQVYAISVLQALAKVSGRKLPIIIDTPLGRLDSIHRLNLAKNYFPYASQQVIILSTDTEIDNKFYRLLSGDISHAYRLIYDPLTESTSVREGYFWQQKEVA